MCNDQQLRHFEQAFERNTGYDFIAQAKEWLQWYCSSLRAPESVFPTRILSNNRPKVPRSDPSTHRPRLRGFALFDRKGTKGKLTIEGMFLFVQLKETKQTAQLRHYPTHWRTRTPCGPEHEDSCALIPLGPLFRRPRRLLRVPCCQRNLTLSKCFTKVEIQATKRLEGKSYISGVGWWRILSYLQAFAPNSVARCLHGAVTVNLPL